MNSVNCHFDTDSIFINETNNSHSNLDWTAFHSLSSPIERNACSPIWLSLQEDAVAPNDRLSLTSTSNENNLYFRNESTVTNEFHQQTEVQTLENNVENMIESVYTNNSVPNQITGIKEQVDSPVRKIFYSNVDLFILP